MANVYPTRVQFLLADGVRQEQGSKLTVLGFYPGNNILLTNPLPKMVPEGLKGIALPGITTIVTILDGHGSFDCNFQVIRPSGKTMGKGVALQVTKTKDVAANLLLPMEPFPVLEFGVYRMVLKLNTRKYEFKFRVGHTDPNVQVPGEAESKNVKGASKRTTAPKTSTSPKTTASRTKAKATSR